MKPYRAFFASSLVGAIALLAQIGGTDAIEPPAPISVGVRQVRTENVILSDSFIGRIQATERVDVVPRVTGYLDRVEFVEGAEVKKGDVLYRLEQPPFQADLAAKQGVVAQQRAQLINAAITLRRAQMLLQTPAGLQSNLDAATASKGNLEGQLLSAEANVRFSEINLAYTTITSPINGKIGRTGMTAGNVVRANAGVLATVVGQDPMYVLFPVSVRLATDLVQRYAGLGGLKAAQLRLQLPNGLSPRDVGGLDFVDNTVSSSTDTITLRGVMPNPADAQGARTLVDGEFVTVTVESRKPVPQVVVSRSAVLTDGNGAFVYVLGRDNRASRRAIIVGQAVGTDIVASSGLGAADTVIVDGLQQIRDGAPVNPLTPPRPPSKAGDRS